MLTMANRQSQIVPYWNEQCAENSSLLLMPSPFDNAWTSRTLEQSWFSAGLHVAQTASAKLFKNLSIPAQVTDSIVKSKKIRIYPSAQQKNMIKRWFGTSRKVYNMTVELLKDESIKPSWKSIKTELIHSLPEWAKQIPYQIKSLAVNDACETVRECRKRTKQSGDEHIAHFRSRHEPRQSCYIPKSALSKRGVYHTILGKMRLSEPLPAEFGDCRLVMNNGRYYLAIPKKVSPQHTDNQGRVVALDPGIRSFMTMFSENSYGWIGKSDIGRIQRLCSHLDSLISRAAKATAAQRYRMRRAQARMRNKIRDLIDELHHKAAHFLVENFDVILLPTFESSEMVVRSARKINSKTARSMLNFAHFRFKQFLKHKAFEYGKVVLDVCEAYTSKTVSWTGEIIANLGGRKFITSSDGRTMDRDLNGARGIMLRALVDTPSPLIGSA